MMMLCEDKSGKPGENPSLPTLRHGFDLRRLLKIPGVKSEFACELIRLYTWRRRRSIAAASIWPLSFA